MKNKKSYTSITILDMLTQQVIKEKKDQMFDYAFPLK